MFKSPTGGSSMPPNLRNMVTEDMPRVYVAAVEGICPVSPEGEGSRVCSLIPGCTVLSAGEIFLFEMRNQLQR